jgi:hypothetical protein
MEHAVSHAGPWKSSARRLVAPGVRLCWWFTVDPHKRLRCSVKIDVPRTLNGYELVDIEERTDIISFPVQ